MAEWTKAPDKALAESGVRIPLSSTVLFLKDCIHKKALLLLLIKSIMIANSLLSQDDFYEQMPYRTRVNLKLKKFYPPACLVKFRMPYRIKPIHTDA